jgi:anti-anti-sigma factor
MISPNEDRFVLVQVQGPLNASSSSNLQEQLAKIEPQAHGLWILDLERVDFIDSAGLVTLIAALKAAQKSQCRMVICNLHPCLRVIFEITQLDRAFEILDTGAELVAA